MPCRDPDRILVLKGQSYLERSSLLEHAVHALLMPFLTFAIVSFVLPLGQADSKQCITLSLCGPRSLPLFFKGSHIWLLESPFLACLVYSLLPPSILFALRLPVLFLLYFLYILLFSSYAYSIALYILLYRSYPKCRRCHGWYDWLAWNPRLQDRANPDGRSAPHRGKNTEVLYCLINSFFFFFLFIDKIEI